MKQCNLCQETKPTTEFWKGKARCKSCIKEVNPYNPERNRDRHLNNKYGITSEIYNEMEIQHNFRCQICRVAPDMVLHVDHCHDTGKVRGLLCYKCNSLLGYADDNVEILARAIRYLRKHNAK